MKQDECWRPTLNARATQIQQLKPEGPTKDRASSRNQLKWKFLGRTRPCAIREDSKVVNRDWINHQTAVCRITFMLYPVLL